MGALDFSINEKLLEFLRTQLNLSCFIETGTFEGASLAIAARHLPECHSVELSPEYYTKAKERFRGTPNVKLHQGSSPEVLKQLAPGLGDKACLYWLDAHWCVAANTAGENSQSPLLSELAAISNLNSRSVVLIDDARLYLCAPPHPHRYQDWPSIAEIIRLLGRLSETHTFSVLNDVIAFYPLSIAKAFDRFAYENAVDWHSIVLSQRALTARLDARKSTGKRLWKNIRRLFSRRTTGGSV